MKTKHAPLFEFENETAPNYRFNLSRVFGEKFLAEATLKDKNLQTIIRLVKAHNWEQLKVVSKYYYNLRNNLSVARSGCLIYDGKLVIPHQLQNLVIKSEPNDELQLDFAGPIVDTKNNNNEHYILAAVDRFWNSSHKLRHANSNRISQPIL